MKGLKIVAPDSSVVGPVRSAKSRSATLPGWAITPTPSAETDKPDDHDVRLTYRVLPFGRPGTLDKFKSSLLTEHFGVATRRSRRSAVNDPG